MKVGRKGATSFVYENQLFVAGGCDSDVIDVLNLNDGQLEWGESVAKLPYHCESLRSVVYQDRAILFCSCEKAHYCAELCLNAPYKPKQLCKMPKPVRNNCVVVAFEHKVLIFGGQSDRFNLLDTVLQFDVSKNKFKVMPSLPHATASMAAVRWGDEAVLIGGAKNVTSGLFNPYAGSKNVFMYNSKTGNSTELPSMLEERVGCSAVITGNTIVVMGGRGRSGRVRSVEAFTLGGYSWRYLPAMNDIRSVTAATVLPTKNTN